MSKTSTTANPPADPPAVIDLTEPVSFEVYAASIQAIWTFFKDVLVGRHGWCSDWVGYVRTLLPDFPDSRRYDNVTALEVVNPYPREVFTDDGWETVSRSAQIEYANRLSQLRGRLAYYASRDSRQISVDEMNEILTVANLPTVEIPETGGTVFYAYTNLGTLYFLVPGESDYEAARTLFKSAWNTFVGSLGELSSLTSGQSPYADEIEPEVHAYDSYQADPPADVIVRPLSGRR